jgi:hypothetical protein
MDKPLDSSKKVLLIVSEKVIGTVERELKTTTYPVLNMFHLDRLEVLMTCPDDPGLLS